MEGVMMRGAFSCAVAMRSPTQEIVLHTERLGAVYRSRLKQIPFLRGLIMLWDGLGLGMRALTLSANVQTGEEKKIEGPVLYLTIAASLGFAIGLFFVLPAMLAEAGETVLHWDAWASNAAEGGFRLSLLVAYLWAVGRMPNIRRVFAYHGAEHQTINAFEAGAELTPENVASYPLEHTRCGTSFLLTLVLISILIFSLLGPMLAGIAYEYTRWTAANLDHVFVRWLIRPNLALQRLTTRRPTLDMIEVAIAAFVAMRTKEGEWADGVV
jgi:uncharacterized protein YqhQ